MNYYSPPTHTNARAIDKFLRHPYEKLGRGNQNWLRRSMMPSAKGNMKQRKTSLCLGKTREVPEKICND